MKYDGSITALRAEPIISEEDKILVTGASGFIGARVVENLVNRGFRNLRCLTRSGHAPGLQKLVTRSDNKATIEVMAGNLLSREDCIRAVNNVSLIYHLAAGRGEKAFPDAFMNSAVATRNLIEACRGADKLKRIVSVSSFSVYSSRTSPVKRVLDETSAVEERPADRGDAYSYAKIKQDQILAESAQRYALPYVIVRPGVVYGTGNEAIHGRVGIGSFGIFLHLGGSNRLPLTYVDNCAEAIVLAGLQPAVDGEVFNVIDDDLPSCRQFLRLYKKKVQRFRSVYLPHSVSYLICYLWERYSAWSQGQLPPVYNRSLWRLYWKKTHYTNRKIKERLGWVQKISTADALDQYFESCRKKAQHA